MPRRIRRHNHIVPREEEEENPLMKALARDQSAAEIRENIWKTNTHYGCGIFFAANFYNLTAYCFPPCLHKAGEAFTRTFFSLVFAILTIWIRHVKNGYDHLREIDVCNCDSCKGQPYSVKTVEQIQWKIEKANSAVKRMVSIFKH
ncbi:Protein CBG26029 [Caenorhabditis briggsae]|uniref:Protein CBG26029 n=2 Tax=Caenorhabditis briggsae TaxID=6238 RepID=B6ILH3_CAEBR|nr:Protein CBG26029 [Caenorhabditis briggsae]ULU02697.1 hypothetical protein L3Y34_002348 [Caenorhabditis briggsae]CAS00753.1 Protein CBG26029 [Caenorhabditis briggsae]